MTGRLLLAFVLVLSAATVLLWRSSSAEVKPTLADVRYGSDARQALDFYRAKSDTPTPVVLAFHGGGWTLGDKLTYRTLVNPYLKAGISVVAVNYRFLAQAAEAKVDPPVKWPTDDAVRAVQFVRSKAKAWNLDPKRVAAAGASAGGCSALYLLYHDDLADPDSADPVERESTRLACAAVLSSQTTLDPKLVREWIPNGRYGGHAFGVRTPEDRDGAFPEFLEQRERLLSSIREYSPLTHVTADDPPVFMEFPDQKMPAVKGEVQTDPIHSALYGMILMERLKEVNVEGIVVYPGHPHEKYRNSAEFLIDRLKQK